MVTLDAHNIEPFWDDEYKNLNYRHEQFNNSLDVSRWTIMGYPPKFTGDMCDMRSPQPSWNHRVVQHFENLGWQDIGTSYYRMSSGTVLPEHIDTYSRYIELFNLQGQEKSIRRALIFLEDWASGHYLEIQRQPIVGWSRGDYYVWYKDTPHMAANMGTTLRYTLQVTGHI